MPRSSSPTTTSRRRTSLISINKASTCLPPTTSGERGLVLSLTALLLLLLRASCLNAQAVARHATRHLQSSGALKEAVLVRHPRHVLHRRRRPPRQRRLLLDHGTNRRCAERLRPSPRHRGSRERHRQPRSRRRGRG